MKTIHFRAGFINKEKQRLKEVEAKLDGIKEPSSYQLDIAFRWPPKIKYYGPLLGYRYHTYYLGVVWIRFLST